MYDFELTSLMWIFTRITIFNLQSK